MCQAVCPEKAIFRTETAQGDPVVRVESDKCVGCHSCMVACPFGAISFFKTLKAVKCDLCDGSPQCVEFCFYDCLQFVELPEQAAADRAKRVRALALKACRHIAEHEVRKRQVSFSLEASRVTPTISTDEKNESIGLDLDSLLQRDGNK